MSHEILSALSDPLFYRAVQFVLAPNGNAGVRKKVRQLGLEPGQRALDVGCGPASVLISAGPGNFGLDVDYAYVRAYSATGPCVVASADHMPFRSESFDSVWTLGMLHHLPDPVAAAAVCEMVRVCRPGGVVVVIDAVMPKCALTRPAAYILRRLDRGRFVRTEAQLLAVIETGNSLPKYSERFTYTLNGMELLISACRLPRSRHAPVHHELTFSYRGSGPR